VLSAGTLMPQKSRCLLGVSSRESNFQLTDRRAARKLLTPI
jgi:hypothetical protein